MRNYRVRDARLYVNGEAVPVGSNLVAAALRAESIRSGRVLGFDAELPVEVALRILAAARLLEIQRLEQELEIPA